MSMCLPFTVPSPQRRKAPSTSNVQASPHWVASEGPAGWDGCSSSSQSTSLQRFRHQPGAGDRGAPRPPPAPETRGPRQTGMDLDVRDGGVAVPVVDLDVALAPEVSLKDVTVAVVPPPGAELPVPGAVQHVEELGVLHADHGEEVLVPQVAAEAVLVGQLPHLPRLQQAAVQGGLAHGLQVQQHHPAVEAGEPLGGRAPNPGLGVLVAELPERVPGRGKESRFNLVCVGETGCRP